MGKPVRPASIDNCGNCMYWGEEFSDSPPTRVCKIMSDPFKYKNVYAFASVIHDTRPIVATAWEFHCTLYKVKSK